jgi:hypothetical protein
MINPGLDDALDEVAGYRGWRIERSSGGIRVIDAEGNLATARIRRGRNAWWLEAIHEDGTKMLSSPERTITRAVQMCQWHKLGFRAGT